MPSPAEAREHPDPHGSIRIAGSEVVVEVPVFLVGGGGAHDEGRPAVAADDGVALRLVTGEEQVGIAYGAGMFAGHASDSAGGESGLSGDRGPGQRSGA